MEETLRRLLGELRLGLERIYGPRLRGVYLYGSRSRGEESEESDVDVVVVLDEVEHYAAEVDRTGTLVSKLSLEYGVSISRVFVSEHEWLTGETTFLMNVRDEAVPV